MKKALALFVICLLLFAACAGGAKPAAGADELDIAIREASDYLNTRIPNGNKVAFINISGGYPDLADYILSDLSKHGVNDSVFSVVDRALLDQVRAELNFNWSGEVDDNSAQEIGRMLGAQTIVSGSVRRLGALFRLEVKAIAVQTAAIQGQWSRNVPNGMTIAALTTNTSSATTAAIGGGTNSTATASGNRTSGTTTASQSPAGNTAQPATPAAPVQVLKNGIYTLNPRPRVRQAGGQWEDMWITKVEVENRFITFYFDDRATGAGRGYGNSHYSDWYTGHVTLYNLDRPSNFVKSSGITGYYIETIIFPRIDAKRFKMETIAYGRDKAFEEIILGEPDE